MCVLCCVVLVHHQKEYLNHQHLQYAIICLFVGLSSVYFMLVHLLLKQLSNFFSLTTFGITGNVLKLGSCLGENFTCQSVTVGKHVRK